MTTTTNPPKPSQIKCWDEIDKSLAMTAHVAGNPQQYGWYLLNGFYYPHRKPTVTEFVNDKFHSCDHQ